MIGGRRESANIESVAILICMGLYDGIVCELLIFDSGCDEIIDNDERICCSTTARMTPLFMAIILDPTRSRSRSRLVLAVILFFPVPTGVADSRADRQSRRCPSLLSTFDWQLDDFEKVRGLSVA